MNKMHLYLLSMCEKGWYDDDDEVCVSDFSVSLSWGIYMHTFGIILSLPVRVRKREMWARLHVKCAYGAAKEAADAGVGALM